MTTSTHLTYNTVMLLYKTLWSLGRSLDIKLHLHIFMCCLNYATTSNTSN